MAAERFEELLLAETRSWNMRPQVVPSRAGTGLVLNFPQGRNVRFVANVKTAVFSIFKGSNAELSDYVTYTRQADGTFRQTAGQESYPLSCGRAAITKVTRETYGENGEPLRGEEDVTPSELTTQEGFLLFRVEARGPQRDAAVEQKERILPNFQLHARRLYLVVPLRRRIEQVTMVAADGVQEMCRLEDGGLFSPYTDSRDQPIVKVIIDGIEHEVVSSVEDYLMAGIRMDHISVFRRPGYIVCRGDSRVFNQQCRDEGIVPYFRKCGQMGYGTRLDVNVPVPESLYWQPGDLKLLLPNGKWLGRLPVVFVDDVPREVDCSNATDEGAPGCFRVWIAGEDRYVPIPPPRKPASICIDKQVGNRTNSFLVRMEVRNNYRVVFGVTNRSQEIQVRASANYLRPITEIASRDFEFLQGRLLGWGAQTTFITRGKTAIQRLPHRVFNGSGILQDPRFQAEADTHYVIAFCDEDGRVQREALFPFTVYDQRREPVEHARKGQDLILTYRCAFVDRKKDKFIRVYATHRAGGVVETTRRAKRVEEESGPDERTNCYREVLRVPDFYAPDSGIDWGLGLLCFIVAQESEEVEHVVSSDFWVAAPEALASMPENDPFGVRIAFAGEMAAWGRVVTSPAPQVREAVRAFWEQLQKAMAQRNLSHYRYSHWKPLIFKPQAQGANYPTVDDIQRVPETLLMELDLLIEDCRRERQEPAQMPEFFSLQNRTFKDPRTIVYSPTRFDTQCPGVYEDDRHFCVDATIEPARRPPERELWRAWQLIGETLYAWQTAANAADLDRALVLLADIDEVFASTGRRLTDAVFLFAEPQR